MGGSQKHYVDSCCFSVSFITRLLFSLLSKCKKLLRSELKWSDKFGQSAKASPARLNAWLTSSRIRSRRLRTRTVKSKNFMPRLANLQWKVIFCHKG